MAAAIRGVTLQTMIVMAFLLASGLYMGAADACAFSSSCSDMRYESGYLYATCKNWIGYNLETRIYLNNGVKNNGGTLECYRLSGGGFLSSCSDISVSGSILTATCTDSDGISVVSSVDLDTCISNDNANLQWCDSDSNANATPTTSSSTISHASSSRLSNFLA